MILFWNARGINDPRKQKRLKVALRKFNVNIICLLETHVKQNSSLAIAAFLAPGWNFVANYDHADLGRIWILSDQNVRLEVFAMTDQIIHYHIFFKTQKKYSFLSVVYGVNSVVGRRMLWNDLKIMK